MIPGSVEELLPFRNLFTAEEVAQQFERRRIDRVPDKKLLFEIDIPKSWELRPPTTPANAHDTERLTSLAAFLPEDENALIEVQYMRVPEGVAFDDLQP